MNGQSATPHSAQSKMRKFFLLASLCTLFGCIQQEVFYTVFLKNTCDYPIDVSVPKKHRVFSSSEKDYLNPGEEVAVITLICTDASRLFTIRTSSWAIGAMSSCLQNDYKLTITGEGKERILDGQQVLDAMKRAEYTGEKIHFWWTISDPTLCPK